MVPAQNILEIENVTVSYGRQKAVGDISLALRAGETFGLIGLNGAGKTTLIKTILGLRPADSGSVKLFGLSPTNASARSRLAFLPERFDPPWFLSGKEFLRFSLKLYKREFIESEVMQAVEKVALDPAALRRRVQTYSKGMRQKLGLLATMLTGCDLMILDEPMSGLDPLARKLVKDMILLCKQRGQTIFLSSHILADMDEICDRVAVLHGGVIRFIGAPADLKKKAGAENLESAFLHYVEKRNAA